MFDWKQIYYCLSVQSRALTGLLTGHNTLRKHLYTMGLIDNPLCRGCGAEEVTLAHVLCECEDLATIKYTSLGSFFLDPEDVRSLSLGAKGTGLPWLGHQSTVHKGHAKSLRASAPKGVEPICYSILFRSLGYVFSVPDCILCLNTLSTGDADLRFYITTMQDGWRKSAFLTRACFPCTIHLIMQYIEPVSEWSCWRMFIENWSHSELTFRHHASSI